MEIYEGKFDGTGHRFGIVVSRFNQPITERLLSGALDGLKRHGVSEQDIAVAWVPGAFEVPLAAKKMADSNRFDALICLGAVIRGETAHFDFVASQSAAGILQTSLSQNIPIIYSILTTETIEQAETRSGIKGTNYGFSGALSAIEMINTLKELETCGSTH